MGRREVRGALVPALVAGVGAWLWATRSRAAPARAWWEAFARPPEAQPAAPSSSTVVAPPPVPAPGASHMPSSQSSDERIRRLARLLDLPEPVVRAIREVESSGDPRAFRFEPHLALRKVPGLRGLIPYTPDQGRDGRPSYVRSETDRAAFSRAWQAATGPLGMDHPTADRLLLEASSLGEYQVRPEGLWSHLADLWGAPVTGRTLLEAFDRDPKAVSDDLLVAWFRANPGAVRAALEAVAKGGSAEAWRPFAATYNGPGYEAKGYHERLASAYQRAASFV